MQEFLLKLLTRICSELGLKLSIAILSALAGSGIFWQLFGDKVIARAIVNIIPSHIEISYKSDKIKEVLKDLQARCGERDCYSSKISLEEKPDKSWLGYFHSVQGWHPVYKRVVDLKQFADANSLYYQKIVFDGREEVGIDMLQNSPNRCVSLTREDMKRHRIARLEQAIDGLKVPVEKVIACAGYGNNKEIQWVTMLTIKRGATTNCGSCISEVYDANFQIQKIWNN